MLFSLPMSIGTFVACFGHLSAGRMARHGARTRSEGTHALPVLPEIIVVLRFQAFCHENGFSGSFRFLGLATFFFSGARFDACFLAHFIGHDQQRPLLPQAPTRAKASTPSHRWLDFTPSAVRLATQPGEHGWRPDFWHVDSRVLQFHFAVVPADNISSRGLNSINRDREFETLRAKIVNHLGCCRAADQCQIAPVLRVGVGSLSFGYDQPTGQKVLSERLRSILRRVAVTVRLVEITSVDLLCCIVSAGRDAVCPEDRREKVNHHSQQNNHRPIELHQNSSSVEVCLEEMAREPQQVRGRTFLFRLFDMGFSLNQDADFRNRSTLAIRAWDSQMALPLLSASITYLRHPRNPRLVYALGFIRVIGVNPWLLFS